MAVPVPVSVALRPAVLRSNRAERMWPRAPVSPRSARRRGSQLPAKGDHMAMSIREAFDRGTDAFNAHDLAAFGELFSDDVVQNASGGVHLEGRAAAMEFYGVWLEAFPDARIDLD